MGYVPPPPPNWRNDPGMKSVSVHTRNFAFLNVLCSDGTRVWMKPYYKKYDLWSHSGATSHDEDEYLHTDFVENITEAEYMVRKLAGTL